MKRDQIQKCLHDYRVKGPSLLLPEVEDLDNWWRTFHQDKAYKFLLDEIREEAGKLIHGQDPELTYSLFQAFWDNGSRVEYEEVYFRKRRRLNTFAMMSLLDPDQQVFREALQNTLWSICNEYTWCLPAHLSHGRTNIHFSLEGHADDPHSDALEIDLFAAETAFSLSEILSLTDRFLHPLIKGRIHEEVYRRIFRPYVQNVYHWETATHNWSAVCAGSIGAAALHLIDDVDDLSLILEKVLHSLEFYLAGFNEDGVCREGYMYWQYGFGYYVYFADLLKKRTGGKIDLFQSEKVHQIARFQQKVFMEGNAVINFSDCPSHVRVFLGMTHYLKQRYPDLDVPVTRLRAKYTDDHCSRWAPAIRNLVWFCPEEKGEPWRAATYYLDASQWYMSRHVSRSGVYVFAAKGGHNAEPHNHNDLGHFIFHARGETFLNDLGCGLYNKAYFSPERYSINCNGSQGHSVPVINHQFQCEGISQRAFVEEAAYGNQVDSFTFNLTKAYRIPHLQRLTRRFTWHKTHRPTLILEDSYVFTEEPESIVERFVTPIASIDEYADELKLVGKHCLHITFDRKVLEPKIQTLDFIDHDHRKVEQFAIDFTLVKPRKESKARFVFHFE